MSSAPPQRSSTAPPAEATPDCRRRRGAHHRVMAARDARRLLEMRTRPAAQELARLDGDPLDDMFVALCVAAHQGSTAYSKLAALLVVLDDEQCQTGGRSWPDTARDALARRCGVGYRYDHPAPFDPHRHLEHLRGAFGALRDPLTAQLVCYELCRGLLASANGAVCARETTRFARRLGELGDGAASILAQLLDDHSDSGGQVGDRLIDAADQLAAGAR